MSDLGLALREYEREICERWDRMEAAAHEYAKQRALLSARWLWFEPRCSCPDCWNEDHYIELLH